MSYPLLFILSYCSHIGSFHFLISHRHPSTPGLCEHYWCDLKLSHFYPIPSHPLPDLRAVITLMKLPLATVIILLLSAVWTPHPWSLQKCNLCLLFLASLSEKHLKHGRDSANAVKYVTTVNTSAEHQGRSQLPPPEASGIKLQKWGSDPTLVLIFCVILNSGFGCLSLSYSSLHL